MLELKNIVKTYVTGDLKQDALKGVSINFRENEFVSILGQSGSGKTTMLNIIGGLDRYTSGDLVINGVSTTDYKDSDWDYYRNNSIGFVFQSYNLIPHQTVLQNVEMSLTLSGVSKKERRARAIEVLKKVGLEEHIHKRPNQMSGGQMQRVAIARALINNPDILLADEPTGALDSETSVQIMELLKEIAKDKLVIMVTHNPELAEKYSTRIVKLLDGSITDDSNPYKEEDIVTTEKEKKKISMSFGTALGLSFNNLRTKKGRTVLTAFAGSIGIIGIALILALSTGMNQYITDIQKETMASYPITIESETYDTSSLFDMSGMTVGEVEDENETTEERTQVYADYTDLETKELISTSIIENNLTDFKAYLDDPDSEIHDYIGENGIVYSYDVSFDVYSYNEEDELVNSDVDLEEAGSESSFGDSALGSFMLSGYSMMTSMVSDGSATNFTEMMPGTDDNMVSAITTDSYDLVYGSWPESYDEVVLVLDKNNAISSDVLYQLGFITIDEYNEAVEKIENGEEAEEISFNYEDMCEHTFYLLSASDHYIENEDGTFSYVEDYDLEDEGILDDAVSLKISGIIRPAEDADNADIYTAVAYTSALTDYIISHTDESEVIKAQEEDENINVLTGIEFEPASDEEKAADAKEYVSEFGVSDKAALYQMIMYYSASEEGTDDDADDTSDGEVSDDTASADVSSEEMTDADMSAYEDADMSSYGDVTGTDISAYAAMGATATDETTLAAMFDEWLENDPDQDILLMLYEEYIGSSSYEDNLEAFGKVSKDAPSSINIYTDDFEAKDGIAESIENYNRGVDEDSQIIYTDYVAMMTSSLTTIINAITYVLIAFVAISLFVSCIMIGIITNISVLERTKEIGILRALGASKGNISLVFNAETFIIGCCAGFLGVVISLLALIPINAIVKSLTGIENLRAILPWTSSVVLIIISIVITIIGGFIPARKAAKKDPVEALRTE